MENNEKLLEILRDGIAVFEYVKANGETRFAVGTLNQDILDSVAGKTGVDWRSSEGKAVPVLRAMVITKYFDLEKVAWRYVQTERLNTVVSIHDYLDGETGGFRSSLPAKLPDLVMELYQESVVDTLFGDSSDETPGSGLAESLLDRIHRDYPCPKTDDGFVIGQKSWDFLVTNILNCRPMMLVGPTGCGKTELVAFAAKRLGIPFRASYDMGSMHDPLAQMLGTHRLAEGEKGTRSVFDYARFAREIQEPGIILLDELSRAPETTLNFLLPVLDGRRSLPVEAAGETDRRNIPVHPGCVFIATANIGQEYVGTRSLDPALASRFTVLELSYLDIDLETALLVNRTGIRTSVARKVAVAMADIRKLAQNDDVEGSVSVRESLRVAEFVRDGWDLQDALEMVVLPMYEGTNTEGNRGTVRKSILSR